MFPNCISKYLCSLINDDYLLQAHIGEVMLQSGHNQTVSTQNFLKSNIDYVPLELIANTAVRNGNLDILKITIDLGVDLNKSCIFGYHLIDAVKEGHLHIVEFLLNPALNIDINQQNREGNTALHISVIYDNYNIFLKLIEYDADVNIKNFKGETPLYLSLGSFDEYISTSQKAIFNHLLSHGANMKSLTYKKESIPMKACRINSYYHVKRLILAGCDLEEIKVACKTSNVSFLDKLTKYF